MRDIVPAPRAGSAEFASFKPDGAGAVILGGSVTNRPSCRLILPEWLGEGQFLKRHSRGASWPRQWPGTEASRSKSLRSP